MGRRLAFAFARRSLVALFQQIIRTTLRARDLAVITPIVRLSAAFGSGLLTATGFRAGWFRFAHLKLAVLRDADDTSVGWRTTAPIGFDGCFKSLHSGEGAKIYEFHKMPRVLFVAGRTRASVPTARRCEPVLIIPTIAMLAGASDGKGAGLRIRAQFHDRPDVSSLR